MCSCSWCPNSSTAVPAPLVIVVQPRKPILPSMQRVLSDGKAETMQAAGKAPEVQIGSDQERQQTLTAVLVEQYVANNGLPR